MSTRERAISRNKRPIFIATYQEVFHDDPEDTAAAPPAEVPPAAAPAAQAAAAERHVAIRRQFPAAGSDYNAGESDGYVYQSVFAGSKLDDTLNMIREFLQQEGYSEIPLPRDAGELELFRNPARQQHLLLFADNGYVHNPIKILFPADRRRKTQLILQIFNEKDPDHLVKFHRLEDRRRQLRQREG